MNAGFAFALTAPALFLVTATLVPSRHANAMVVRFRNFITLLAGMQLIVATTLAVGLSQ